MDLPFDGAITRFFETDFPEPLRRQVEASGGRPILPEGFPYRRRLKREAYREEKQALQIELVKMQGWARESGARVCILLEGRDAAGKGGTIKRFREHLNPRGARVVALPKPTERERGQWYFQRYIEHLPSAGEVVFFDRSWYNRAVVERIFGFCTEAERSLFFDQVTPFEDMLVRDGIHLYKLWLTVGRAEQMRRMRDRERDPLKHWKLSAIDIEGLGRWEAYSLAIHEMFERTHSNVAPWCVIRADDKRRARLAAQRAVLSDLPYARREPRVARPPDPGIAGRPEAMRAQGVDI
jgi:polyphosphate kinase 2